MSADLPAAPKPAAWRRWTAIALRTAHLAAVVLTGIAVLGAPHPARAMGRRRCSSRGCCCSPSSWPTTGCA